MIYSVFDAKAKKYDYFEGPGRINSVAHFRKPQGAPVAGTFLPSALAVTLPSGTKRVGEGPNAKGVIAKRGGLVAGLLTSETAPSAAWAGVFLGLGFFAARFFREE